MGQANMIRKDIVLACIIHAASASWQTETLQRTCTPPHHAFEKEGVLENNVWYYTWYAAGQENQFSKAEASKFCAFLGGHLSEPRNGAEQASMARLQKRVVEQYLAPGESYPTAAWLGVHCAHPERLYDCTYESDARPVQDKLFWDEDSPNGSGTCVGNTVTADFGGDDYGWFDA